MVKILFLVGEPAVGKSTLFKKAFLDYAHFEKIPFQFKKIRGMHFFGKTMAYSVVGVYNDGDIFSGTDKLSMACQPDFIEWLETTAEGVVVLEGDRFFNQKFFQYCEDNKIETHVFEITAEPALIEHRHRLRGDIQNESWLKSRATKLYNVRQFCRNTKCHWKVLFNNDDTEFQASVEHLKKMLRVLSLKRPQWRGSKAKRPKLEQSV